MGVGADAGVSARLLADARASFLLGLALCLLLQLPQGGFLLLAGFVAHGPQQIGGLQPFRFLSSPPS
ncbi:hypothetical protein ADL30_03035 [Streptomyces sp. NRRL S-1521]|nr:hypothetical protein ADL30_03035 [Streptomyces sp. NRRL S-1521]